MNNKKNIIAIIPARGGSKGIPNKNIIDCMGKPLIAHSIEYAKESDLVTSIYVSTDDAKIAEVARQYGAKIIDRPDSISGDTATTESAIEHVLNNIPKPDIVILLQATSPLRPKESLNKSIEKMISEKYDSLLSLSPTHRFSWKINGDEAIPKYDFKNRPRRQDISESEQAYIENGSIYIFTYENFIKHNNRLGGKIGYVVFEEEFSFEIDTPTDLIVIDSIAKTIK
tara:strand:- start:657 stop:1337 length:681 start_codon:yes stop_codon:yes gene_type:complete